MPLDVQEHPFSEETADYFSRVLREHPELLAILQQNPSPQRLIEGRFNGRPIALLLVEPAKEAWQINQLVVHPANRGRGVATQLRQQAEHLLQAPLQLATEAQLDDD